MCSSCASVRVTSKQTLSSVQTNRGSFHLLLWFIWAALRAVCWSRHTNTAVWGQPEDEGWKRIGAYLPPLPVFRPLQAFFSVVETAVIENHQLMPFIHIHLLLTESWRNLGFTDLLGDTSENPVQPPASWLRANSDGFLWDIHQWACHLNTVL